MCKIEQWLHNNPGKPFLCCEYTHAMGNSCGAMHKYTDLSDREPRYQGGFIWDWADQSLYKTGRDGKVFQAYGGDFQERPTDWEFSGNGIVYGGDHSPSPKMQEVRYNYQNISVSFSKNAFTVKNKNLFTNTDRYDACAVLLREGRQWRRFPLTVAVPPLSEADFPFPEALRREIAFLRDAAPGDELVLTVSFTLREDTLWAKAGHELAFGQTVLAPAAQTPACTLPLEIVQGSFNLGVRGEGFSVLFSSLRPGLSSYVYGGQELLEQMPAPNFWRAPTDNDRGNQMPRRYSQWKAASLYAAAENIPEIERREHSVRVTYRYQLPTAPESACTVSYEVFGDGTVRTELDYKPVAGLADMPEFGMLFRLSADLDKLCWYGLGPEETYVDRLQGGKLGVWEGEVREQLARYLRPQESGNHCGVRWARITDRRGRGIEFAGENLSVRPDLKKLEQEAWVVRENIGEEVDALKRMIANLTFKQAILALPYNQAKALADALQHEILEVENIIYQIQGNYMGEDGRQNHDNCGPLHPKAPDESDTRLPFDIRLLFGTFADRVRTGGYAHTIYFNMYKADGLLRRKYRTFAGIEGWGCLIHEIVEQTLTLYFIREERRPSL